MSRHENKPLSDEELERYARHIVLPEIGGPGQQKLRSARVLVVGAGGLGAPVLEYLAAAGVGTLGIVDDDTVSLSNLQRQVIHETGAIGMSKAASAAAFSAVSRRSCNSTETFGFMRATARRALSPFFSPTASVSWMTCR